MNQKHVMPTMPKDKKLAREELCGYLLIAATVLATSAAIALAVMFLFPESTGWWNTGRFIGTTLIMSVLGYFMFGLYGEEKTG